MEEISDTRFNILVSSRIFQQWSILKVTNMRTLLAEHLPPHILDRCCALDIDNGSALRRLHRHLLQGNNGALYTAIVNYCKCRYEALDDLVDFMCVDLEESHPENDGLTENQHDMLIQKRVILQKLQVALEVNKMTEILQDQQVGDMESICSEANNEEAVYLVYRRIFQIDKRSFLEKIVHFCEDQRDKYKQCFEFMINKDNEDLDGSNHMMMDVPVNRVRRDEVEWMTSRLNELRLALIHVSIDLTKIISDTGHEVNQLNRNVITEVQDQFAKQHEEMLQLQNANTVMLKNEIAQLHSKMQIMENLIQSLAPFPSPPTTEMINTQRTFKWLGLSPMLCNEFGCYPLIDWHTFKEYLGTRRWNMIKAKQSVDEMKKSVSLSLPPLLLPADLGGWMILLFLRWDGDFKLKGGFSPVEHNQHAPSSIMVPMSLKLQINENVTFCTQQTFTLERAGRNDRGVYLYNHLWSICADMDDDWAMPTMSVRVLKQS